MPSIRVTSSSPQFLELALTALLGQSSIVLSDEHHQVFSNPVRHFDRIHDAADRFVVTAQIVDLARQILLNGASDARIQKLRLPRAIEIAERSAVSLSTSTLRSAWVRHSMNGISGPEWACKVVAVIIDAVQHHGRNREHHSRRREFPFGQDVMDQAAVHTPVAILERMDIDEAESGGRCLEHRRRSVFAHAVVRLQQPAHQIVEIIGRAPMNSGSGSPWWSRSPRNTPSGAARRG